MFNDIIVPVAFERFQKLSTARAKYEGTISEARVKELTSPIIMVLLKRPEMLQQVLLTYFEISSEGVAFVNSKLEFLLKGIIKDVKQVQQLATFIFDQFLRKPTEPRILNLIYKLIGVVKHKTSFYKVFIQSLKAFYQSHTPEFFRMIGDLEKKVIVDIFIAFFEYEANYEALNLENVFAQWSIDIKDFIFYLAFTEKQGKNFPLCTALLDNILRVHQEEISTRAVFSRIVSSYKELKLKEVPLMVVYCALLFAQKDKAERQTVDYYLEIFKEGIAKEMTSNEQFWQYLIQFCTLDRIIAEETIPSMLPDNKQTDFFEQYRRLKG